jgi:osmoprotectant transport system ATP-binding protein
MTVVFVTHDIDEGLKLGDHVAVIREGRLVQYAAPRDLLAHPADDFVREFVGTERWIERLDLLADAGVLPAEAILERLRRPATA